MKEKRPWKPKPGHDDDRAFLKAVREATESRLEGILRAALSMGAPAWKIEAIQREKIRRSHSR